ncbi:hypothetical protein [Cognatilysobacter bugurensis]|uniref:EF-hand domain-containing protein n=1 Tax=Cognatilysobacter bugurensis TaxID=543356 RepID=A0A918T0E6_9GAMM|nr:hypothetical protein [Lysobacter bugurensis]GHA80337.1 hypothetical protein GCM10007067_17590 [Lysobacter bugurensis]
MVLEKQDWIGGDLDDNGLLSSVEFNSGGDAWKQNGDAFFEWNSNRDGMLSDTELGEGAFVMLLDEKEFDSGANWFG